MSNANASSISSTRWSHREVSESLLAKIVIAEWIGATMPGAGKNGLSSTLLPLLVGLIIVIVAANLPYIGGILNFVLMLVDLGALVKTLYGMRPAAASRNF